MSYDGWLMEGTVGHVQDDSVWLRKHFGFDAFAWGGTCMGLDEGTESFGDMSVTTKRNVNGGLERDGVMVGMPDLTTDTLTMKKLHHDRKKADLIRCFWDIDQRTTCGGEDEDAWNDWIEITRRCHGKATEGSIPPVTFTGDNEEQMINLPWKSLYSVDLRRIVGQIEDDATGVVAQINAITMAQPPRCGDICSAQEDCVVVAVTETVAAGTPHISVSLSGGALGSWTTTALTAFGAADADDVEARGSFVVVVSNADGSIIYSDDLGTTQVNTTTADITAHPPNAVAMLNQGFVYVAGDDGYVYRSTDAARTWETIEEGDVTISNLTIIKIAPDNPQVIYVASNAADVVMKTENGGRTWYAVTATGTAGTGVFSMLVVDQNHLLVGTDAGEIFESSDGGQTWTEQNEIPGLTTQANTTIADIVGCDCGDFGLVVSDSVADVTYFYRNVDNGASGKWYRPTEMETATATYLFTSLTCCGSSHFIAAGGSTGVGSMAMLLE